MHACATCNGFVPHCEVHLFAVSDILPVRQCPFSASCLFYPGYCYLLQLVAVLEDRVGGVFQKAFVEAWTQTTNSTTCPVYDVQMPYQRNRDLDACCTRDPVCPYFSQEGADSKWPMPKDAALPPPRLSSTPGRRTQSRYGAELVGFPSSRARTT